MTLRAITFDFWNTLFKNDGLEGRKAFRAHALADAAQIPEPEAASVMDSVYAEFMRCHIVEQRTLTPADGARLALDTLEISIGEDTQTSLAEAFAEAILHHPPALIEGAVDAVALAADHAPVGLVCDSGISPGRTLRPILARQGLLDRFTALTFSDEIGVAKPQAPMFHHAAESLGVPPAALLHIGDLEPTDIAGIHGVGGQGILFAGVNARFRDSTSASHVLDRWDDLDELLVTLHGAGNFPEAPGI